MDQARLSDWKRELEQKLASLEEQVQPILVEIERAKQQLELVAKLEVLESGGLTESDREPRRPASIRPANGLSESSTVADAIAEILANEGGPLHITKIKERYIATGRRIPGQGTESNLLAHMTAKDGRFERVAKGTYRLKMNGGNVPPARRVTKRRRRRRSIGKASGATQ